MMNATDGEKLGLKSGDKVRVMSVTNSDGLWKLSPQGEIQMVAKVKLIEGLRPETVAFHVCIILANSMKRQKPYCIPRFAGYD